MLRETFKYNLAFNLIVVINYIEKEGDVNV